MKILKKNKGFLYGLGAAATSAVILSASMAFSSTAQAVSINANASATVLSVDLSFDETTPMSFGSFYSSSGGTIVISSGGGASGSITGVTPPEAGVIDITGDTNNTYTVTVDTTATLTNQTGTGGETMAVSGIESNATSLTTGNTTLNVGATLTVAANQKAGTYQGTYNVTVVYN